MVELADQSPAAATTGRETTIAVNNAAMASSPSNSLNSSMDSGGQRTGPSKKSKRKKGKAKQAPVAGLEAATLMGEDEILEHAEAMDLIESPHKVSLQI